MKRYLHKVCHWLDDKEYHPLEEGLSLVDGDANRLKDTVRELRKVHKLKIKTYREHDSPTNSYPLVGYQKISGITVEEIISKVSKTQVANRRIPVKDGRQTVGIQLHPEDVSRFHAITQYHNCSVIYAVRLLLHHDAKGKLPDPIPAYKRCRKERPSDGRRILVTLSEVEVSYLKSSDETYANQMRRMIDAYLQAHPEIVV